jgi:hypothetical protein
MTLTADQTAMWDCLKDVPVEVPTYSNGMFTVRINGDEYSMRATTFRDGRSYDDPVCWEDLAIYNKDGVLFIGDNDFSEEIYNKIADILDSDYDELANELETERDIDRAEDYFYDR